VNQLADYLIGIDEFELSFVRGEIFPRKGRFTATCGAACFRLIVLARWADG
jgi:hypothetical protein